MQRIAAIVAAVQRYAASNKTVPTEWVDELTGLTALTRAEYLLNENTSFIYPTPHPPKRNFTMRVDRISIGNKWYKVTEVPKDHPTLRVGDNVQCIKEPYSDLKFLYRSDGTTHSLCHGCDYVYVVIVEDDQ